MIIPRERTLDHSARSRRVIEKRGNGDAGKVDRNQRDRSLGVRDMSSDDRNQRMQEEEMKRGWTRRWLRLVSDGVDVYDR